MIVILKMRGQPSEPLIDMGDGLPKIAPEIEGWLIASDVHEARRMTDDPRLQQWLYSMEFPRPGRHELSAGWVGESRYVMLVS